MSTAAQSAHAAAIRKAFPGWYRLSTVTVVRRIADTTAWSQHSYGNAIDAYANKIRLNRLALWTAGNANRHSVARVIYNRRVWESRGRTWRTYRGKNPHTTHVHIDYRPQWVGTPPGRPAGATIDPNRPYATPPDRDPPYGREWLRPIAFAMYGNAGLRARPETATEAQVRARVIGYRLRQGLGRDPRVSRLVWERLAQTGIARGARGRRVESAQRMFAFYRVHPGIATDGIFGGQTQAAVSRFQQQAQVRVTGAIGVNDWNALWWGPDAWALTDDDDLVIIDWRRPPDQVPTGEIGHSWDGALRWVGTSVRDRATQAAAASRSMRSLSR